MVRSQFQKKYEEVPSKPIALHVKKCHSTMKKIYPPFNSASNEERKQSLYDPNRQERSFGF